MADVDGSNNVEANTEISDGGQVMSQLFPCDVVGSPADDLHGRAMLHGSDFQYGDAIRPDDLVAVNFDVKHVGTGGGLFIVVDAENPPSWRGCRRMMQVPDGVSIDISGHGNHETFQSPEAAGWRIVGVVEKVYGPKMV